MDHMRDAPIQRKLLWIILATLLVSLALVLLGIMAYELKAYRIRLARETTELAGFIAANSAPPLAFDDARTAAEILATLQGSPVIAAAVLYTRDGRVFASYARPDQRHFLPPSPPGRPGQHFGLRQLELVRAVQQKGLQLGTLYLRADLVSVYVRLKNYTGIVLVVSLATTTGALLLQRLLRHLLSEPLLELSAMAESIAAGNLTANVPVRSGDEIGRLAGALNRMSTELQQSYRELQESRAQMAGIVATAMDAIVTVDADRRIVHFNAAAERMFGAPAAAVIGNTVDRFLPVLPTGHSAVGQFAEGLKGVRQSGEEFPIEASVSPLEMQEGTLVTAILRDITERKEAEEALRASEHRLRRAEEIAHFGYWRYEAAGDHFTWSEETYRIHGVTPDNFNPTLANYLLLVHPEDRERFHRAVKEGEPDLQFRIVRPDGTLRYLTATSEVVRQASAEGSGELFGTFLDSTELRQAERDLQEKNAELERFTYTVSHDLKSPLVTIKSFLGYLEQDMTNLDQEKINKDIFYIRGAAEKMGVLLDELLEMSRIGRIINQPVPVTLRELMDEALVAVAGTLSEREVEVQVTGDATLYGDRPRLVEIWQNLIENAAKFMGEQSAPRIEVGVEATAGGQVFYVRDNGIGIDPRYVEKIFGLFEKLDPKSRGTGLGLALVRRIVQLYQGKLWVESPGIGRGACFYFTLPAALGGRRNGA